VPFAASSSGGSALPLLFGILLIGAMYFLFIRPQQRRNRAIQAMQSTLGVGDEVMTGSGIYGTVVEIDDESGTIDLEIAPDVTVKFARGAVAKVVASAAREESDEDEAEPDEETDAPANQVIERRD
jgi:preprotein translocase subunit YajC